MLRLARVTRLRSFDFAFSPLRIHQRVFSCADTHKMAAESTGTHKDPVTGEMISKQHVLVQITFACAHRSLLCRELKRREKHREKEARRAANAASQPSASTNDGTGDNVANEDSLSPNVSHVDVSAAAAAASEMADGQTLLGPCLFLNTPILINHSCSNILSFVHDKFRGSGRHNPQIPTHTSSKCLVLLLRTLPSTALKESSNPERRPRASPRHSLVASTAFEVRAKS